MISEEERKAENIFEELYPDREFENTQEIPRDIDQLDGQGNTTEADVISVQDQTVIGCEVKAGTSSIKKGFDQLNTVYNEFEEQGFEVDYRLLVFDEEALKLKKAYRELDRVFDSGALVEDYGMSSANAFFLGYVVNNFEFSRIDELAPNERIPRHDFNFLRQNDYLEKSEDGVYIPNGELGSLSEDMAYFGPRADFLFHPNELTYEQPYQSI